MLINIFKIRVMLILSLVIFLTNCGSYHIKPQYASVKGGHIEYYKMGQGSPIVLIPGYLTDVSSWNKRFLAALAEQHELIILNNRNVGGSVVNSKLYHSEDLASDTNQVIHELKLNKPAVIGVSMGGMIAQQLAILYPQDVGQLILINTAIAGKEALQPDSVIQKKLLVTHESKIARYFTALDLYFPRNERSKIAFALIFDRFLPAKLKNINQKALKDQQLPLLLKWNNDEESAKKLSSVNTPTLILNGKADTVIPPDNAEILQKKLPNATLKRWNNGGHGMVFQYPKPIASEINQFIAAH